ncbi:MAG: hydrogenase expression/formation protein HypE [Candidatus Aeolococcus gillhamiae]|uniref:Hydrogenase expression/formation protein HypE n=1 Tax=Candidatus Aeolococcus gillhamiae TaxID=3127015 RepID=A0A2W5Z1V1_9BACT|nr:MAG: hydrogenase expression/formation protein HypE [Candidatus Dormibacter sp. RRmetagenome_bin12]
MTETSAPAPGSGAAIRAAAARIADPEQRVLERIAEIRKRRPLLRETAITMSHGAGGKASHTLTAAVFADILDNPVLAQLGDQAILRVPGLDGARLAMTTDSFVVSPLFFPGGDIGELAINGTVNDLAVGGAIPLAVSAAFILEEGLDIAVLRRVVESMRRAADAAGVSVVTGDTKVVPRGKADQLFITTTGVGLVAEPDRLGIDRVKAGDAVLLSGAMGNHGATVMLARGDVDLEADTLASDTMALNGLTGALLDAGIDVHFMRDATRGGVATVLNEIAQQAGLAVAIDEDALPVHDVVRGVAEILGIDPLYIANEGKLVAMVAAEDAQRALALMRSRPEGQEAALIGEVRAEPDGMVFIRTGFGGTRVVDMLIGDPLPRIC